MLYFSLFLVPETYGYSLQTKIRHDLKLSKIQNVVIYVDKRFAISF